MKLAWLTDIHLNFLNTDERNLFYQEIINTGCDGVLISGDIAEAPSIKSILQELANFIKKPVYFVLGNHDYYRGQVDDVRDKMIRLTQSNKLLFWLPASDNLALNHDTMLIGQDGWADGRFGDYNNSRVVLNDSRMITDLYQAKILGSSQLLQKMQQLADVDAKQLEIQLNNTVNKNPQKVIVLTHIPPFKEICLHESKVSNDEWLPFFSSKATGDVLLNICSKNSHIDFWVLCGHTHSEGQYNPLPNLTVKTGHAKYHMPEVQEVVIVT